ncbi:hypothetical protein VB735_07340 [Halotia wernerae UHCC 0503]|nr:hypothetical protein [Halotia wernerae UHCC 0503]
MAFDPPNIEALIEFAAPLAAIALAILVRKGHPAFQLTLVAIAFILLAFPIIQSKFPTNSARVSCNRLQWRDRSVHPHVTSIVVESAIICQWLGKHLPLTIDY